MAMLKLIMLNDLNLEALSKVLGIGGRMVKVKIPTSLRRSGF
jgi:hypothetical protein